jgi:pimeloyl-ACP methyl ester carboxylesterase
MPRATCNGIEIEYETIGKPGDPPVLLIMGLGQQLTRWPRSFCEALVARGRYLILFDNRDIGLSTKLDGAPVPAMLQVYAQKVRGEIPDVPYRLDDMATDTFGLMDALGLQAAHVVGASLGAAIAQVMAITGPERVLSLTSIMSSTHRPGLPFGTPQALQRLTAPLPDDREGFIEHVLESDRLLAGPSPIDEPRARENAAQTYDRSRNPAGAGRQLAAFMAENGRHEALASVRIPSLVIHGAADPMVPVENGRDVAACIPGARYLEIALMGHYLSNNVWPEIIDAIIAVTSLH